MTRKTTRPVVFPAFAVKRQQPGVGTSMMDGNCILEPPAEDSCWENERELSNFLPHTSIADALPRRSSQRIFMLMRPSGLCPPV
jgi:hypothetical protein